MFNNDEADAYIIQELPELQSELASIPTNCIYKVMHLLLNYTRKKVAERNKTVVKKCLAIAERLYIKGDAKVKNAVENVYVFSFENIFCQGCAEKDEWTPMIPSKLQSVFISQVLKSNI